MSRQFETFYFFLEQSPGRLLLSIEQKKRKLIADTHTRNQEHRECVCVHSIYKTVSD